MREKYERKLYRGHDDTLEVALQVCLWPKIDRLSIDSRLALDLVSQSSSTKKISFYICSLTIALAG